MRVPSAFRKDGLGMTQGVAAAPLASSRPRGFVRSARDGPRQPRPPRGLARPGTGGGKGR